LGSIAFFFPGHGWDFSKGCFGVLGSFVAEFVRGPSRILCSFGKHGIGAESDFKTMK